MSRLSKYITPLFHILIWLASYSATIFLVPEPFFTNPAAWITIIVAFYLNVYWLFPKYLGQVKSWFTFSLLFSIIITGVAILEYILDYLFQLSPVYTVDRHRDLSESLILICGLTFFKALVVLPLSFLFQFMKDLIVWKKVSVFAEISIHVLLIGMLYMLSMMNRPNWSPESEPSLFVFKAGYKLLILAVNLSFFYLNAFWLIPNLLRQRKYTFYLIALALLFCVAILFEFGIYNLPVFSPDQRSALIRSIWGGLLIKLIILIGSFLYRFSKDWFSHEDLRKRLESDKLSAELDLLKFQVHPHFLFNSLNNIYSLAMQEVSPRTVSSLGKLGGMMHYMLEECQQTYVSLSKEIEYLQQYIDLQQLRMDQQNKIIVNIDIDGKADTLKIAPMVLIAFVENAFKHGISIREPSFINLKMSLEGNTLNFNIKNSTHAQKENLNGSGLGLKNVKQRLALIYPKRHTLNLEQKAMEFHVDLTLTLEQA